MDYNSISIKPYIKNHLELQREITLIELAPSPYFFVLSICLAYMNMFARFDENPAVKNSFFNYEISSDFVYFNITFSYNEK